MDSSHSLLPSADMLLLRLPLLQTGLNTMGGIKCQQWHQELLACRPRLDCSMLAAAAVAWAC